MSLSYYFTMPTKVQFGVGMLETAGQEAKALNAAKVLIVADQGVIKAGLVARVEQSLKDEKIPYSIYDKIIPNPRDVHCQAGCDFAKSEGIDCIVAIGGGSSIDTAKAIGILMTNPGSILDYNGAELVKNDVPPLIAIPTTAGTGSEVTPFAVITDTSKDYNEKYNIFALRLAPRVALVDPSVLLGLPSHIMASCGIDALVHAVEGYTCKAASPHTDAFNLYAMEKVAKSLRKAVHKPDIAACTDVMLGSTMAGIGVGYADVGSVHCMAEALGSLYDTPHGVANAMFLSVVEKYNIAADLEKHARVAQAIGVDTHGMSLREAAEAGVDAMAQLCIDVDIPKFRDLKGLNTDDFQNLSEQAERNYSTPVNARKITKKEYLELFWKAYEE